MTPICMVDVARHFAKYVDLVVNRGERFTLLRDGKPVAELGPVLQVVRLEDLAAVLNSLSRLAPADAEASSRKPDAAREELRETEESCAS
ncbi:MAG: type II toxin-antitoxin system Phd/YefM family antitoxin [Gemmatimonadetes bacterium]|nr:type II toxin-antitoxin system Phd/YefM family antitoxin [Gemmatimonadota bacterium]